MQYIGNLTEEKKRQGHNNKWCTFNINPGGTCISKPIFIKINILFHFNFFTLICRLQDEKSFHDINVIVVPASK